MKFSRINLICGKRTLLTPKTLADKLSIGGVSEAGGKTGKAPEYYITKTDFVYRYSGARDDEDDLANYD